jgi:multidrug resistance efflux pump
MAGLLRTRVAPWVVWLGTMSAAAWLWQDLQAGTVRGYAIGVTYQVAAPEPARVTALDVVVGQRVRAGQAIARLDDREVAAELEILAAERVRIEAELGAVASETQVRVGEATRGIEESVDAAERALQVARADRGVRAAELAALSAQLETLQGLVDKRMADRRDLDAIAVKHAALKKELQSADATIAQLASQAAGARARRTALPADAAGSATEPLRAELALVRRREQLLALRKEALVLRAPGDGEVTALLLQPGEIAAEGAGVATIAGPGGESGPGDPEVLVCLSEQQAGHVQSGEAALLYTAGPGGTALAAHVARLSPQVAELPLRCRRDPRVAEWGRPAFVALDEPTPLMPGQSFTVAFQGRLSPHAGEPARVASAAVDVAPAATPAFATAAAPASPAAITVPPALAARSRFEPSAIAWAPRLDRFVVVSDDTGLQDRDEHAPWLFTMDVRGRVDPAPLVIAGLDAIQDLEAIAPAPDGGLYVLSSQSRSKKGKRPRPRQRFVHVALGELGARAAAVVELAGLLDGAGQATLARLGIPGTADLDIEGMTATAEGGLLLGLKAPLGPRGEALIWRLARPDELLATGSLAAAELSLWGQVPLGVRADGAAVAGGISELLELADGSLLIATTASGLDPATQDGALVHVTGRAGLAGPRTVRTFPGLKPEGLARSGGAAIVVVFDGGDAAPQWMEQAWPDR